MPSRIDCARLIPGDNSVRQRCGRRPPKSVGALSQERVAEFFGVSARVPQNPLALLVPNPLQNRMPWRLMRLAATDFVLIALNWLILGALMLPLRIPFPRIRLFEFAVGAPGALMGIALLHAALIILIAHTDGLYAWNRGLRQQASILARSILWATVLLSFCYSLQGASRATGALLSCAALLHFAALWAWRWQNQKMQFRGTELREVRNVLIVGADATGRRLLSFLEANPGDGRAFYGFLDNEQPLGDGVIGRIDDLSTLARTGFVDEVILAAPRDRYMAIQVLEEARALRLDVKIVPDLFGCTLGINAAAINELDCIGDLPLISLHAEQVPAMGLVLKRLMDMVGSGLILVIFAPLMAAIAALIKLDSRGEILYRAQRVGKKGKLFRCYKFRTMVSNADALKNQLRQTNNERSGPIFKIAEDPRITRLGRFLRKYSLDELPQLWNVLKGDMSLVGPRPHTADDYAAYEVEHLSRLDVTPGITGLWQVTARRDSSFHRGMELDREYIQSWSLASDMRILARTVLAVVSGSGQ
jgi:exopolysaccharide biosynthesis polyprenyl glycosylphosphotransferase